MGRPHCAFILLAFSAAQQKVVVATTYSYATCSGSTCDELGWDVGFGDDDVCPERDDSPLPDCSDYLNWTSARSFCETAGARLCTLAEMQNDETRNTGCSYTAMPSWSTMT